MQQRALTNPKIQVLWNSVVVGAYGDKNTNNSVLGEGEECAGWGGFGSQGIGIVLHDKA